MDADLERLLNITCKGDLSVEEACVVVDVCRDTLERLMKPQGRNGEVPPQLGSKLIHGRRVTAGEREKSGAKQGHERPGRRVPRSSLVRYLVMRAVGPARAELLADIATHAPSFSPCAERAVAAAEEAAARGAASAEVPSNVIPFKRTRPKPDTAAGHPELFADFFSEVSA